MYYVAMIQCHSIAASDLRPTGMFHSAFSRREACVAGKCVEISSFVIIADRVRSRCGESLDGMLGAYLVLITEVNTYRAYAVQRR